MVMSEQFCTIDILKYLNKIQLLNHPKLSPLHKNWNSSFTSQEFEFRKNRMFYSRLSNQWSNDETKFKS